MVKGVHDLELIEPIKQLKREARLRGRRRRASVLSPVGPPPPTSWHLMAPWGLRVELESGLVEEAPGRAASPSNTETYTIASVDLGYTGETLAIEPKPNDEDLAALENIKSSVRGC